MVSICHTVSSSTHPCIAVTLWGRGINLAKLPQMGYFPLIMSRKCLYALKDRGTGTAVLLARYPGHRLPTFTPSSLPMLPTRRLYPFHEFQVYHLRGRKTFIPPKMHLT